MCLQYIYLKLYTSSDTLNYREFNFWRKKMCFEQLIPCCMFYGPTVVSNYWKTRYLLKNDEILLSEHLKQVKTNIFIKPKWYMSYSTGHFHCNMYSSRSLYLKWNGQHTMEKWRLAEQNSPPPQPFWKINHKIIHLLVCVTQCWRK